MIVLDYETRSEADLTVVGAYNYAKHPTTDIICVHLYDMDTGDELLLYPWKEQMPLEWYYKLKHHDTEVSAVNAEFDLNIHKYVGVGVYGLPYIDLYRWHCASAQFRINALPANLEDAAKAAKVANLKNPRGKELIKALCIPQENGTFNECPDLTREMGAYCRDDVLATVAVLKATRAMTDVERHDWMLCTEMNARGVRIDRQLATLATRYATAEQSELSAQICEVTGGVVTKPTQHQRIKKYVLDAIAESTDKNEAELHKLMMVVKGGKKKISLDKDVREVIITAIDAGSLDIYEDVERLIRLLDAASASSVAKFNKMLLLASPIDDRVRGAFIHAGASQTHRYSSKGLQMHNMKRNCFNATETLDMLDTMTKGVEIDNVMQTLSKLLRPALIPSEGCKFVVGDWSSIEARALPWLSGDDRANKKLDQFRSGVDTYIEAAKGIYNKENITKDDPERQVGKIAELSLGYGGAEGAFSAMAKGYGVLLAEYTVRKIVRQWRAKNPWAVDFWAKLENAAKKAIRARGEKSFKAGRVTYHFVPKLLGGTLICELPDGTFIQYPFAKIEHTDRGDGIVALKAPIKPKADSSNSSHWGTVRLWGGLLAENITQAFCAGLLRDKIRNLADLRQFLVAHVHDEIVLEVPNEKSKYATEELQKYMEAVPKYAEGLPLAASPIILERYGNH